MYKRQDCQSDPVKAVEVNTLGLVHLLECARRTGVRQLVQASTNAMYENETCLLYTSRCV